MKNVEIVRVDTPSKNYPIYIGNNIIDIFPQRFKELKPGKKIAIVTNPTVGKLYLEKYTAAVESSGVKPVIIEIPDGEEYKTQQYVSFIIDALVDNAFDRSSMLIALGGGVVGDITGYAAATYLRGISYIQVPTTLISQVDSSVGGKTGVNHPKGKNLVGAFYQPEMVFIDIEVLSTLPKRELRGGMAEVIKYGVIYDVDFFGFLEKEKENILNLEPEKTAYMIKRCCEIKAEVVSQDEKENSGKRAILNFGHTMGHAVEAVTEYIVYRHGEAVAIGMAYAARLSERLGDCDNNSKMKVEEIIKLYSLPYNVPDIDKQKISEALTHDKKVKDGKINFILCNRIGEVTMKAVHEKEIMEVL